jgi:hypothetical protein
MSKISTSRFFLLSSATAARVSFFGFFFSGSEPVSWLADFLWMIATADFASFLGPRLFLQLRPPLQNGCGS